MTAPIAPQDAVGPDPNRVREDIATLQAAGRSDLVARYLAREGLNPADYQDATGDGSGFVRNLGLAGRGLVQSFGNLAGLPYGLIGSGLQAAGINPPAIFRPQGAAAADQIGLPQPETSGERIALAAVEGMVAGLPFGGLASTPLRAAANLGLAAGSGAAGQAAAEGGAGPGGQMLASLVVGAGVPVAGALGAEAIRQAVAGAATKRQVARQTQALLEVGAGISPTLGQVAQGGMARTTEAGLRNVPGAAQTFRRTLDGQADRIGAKVDDIAGRYSTAGSVEVAGRAAQRGIAEGFVPRFRATSSQLYNRVFQLVPDDTPAIPSQTLHLFARQSATHKAADVFEGLDHPWMEKWSNNLADAIAQNPKGIPFGVLKDFRSRLGEMLTGADLVDGLPMRDVKMLYGAVSDDMRAVIGQKAGAAGLKAWDRASNYWKAGASRLETVLQPLVDKNTPEQAFNFLMSGTRDGATALRTTMRSLGAGEKRLVAATVLRRLGRAAGGAQNAAGDAFSPETYLTNWAKLSPESRMALFEGVDPALTKDLNSLAQALEVVRKTNKIMPNTSGTAPNTAFWSIVTGLSSGMTGLMLGGGGAGLKAGLAGAAVPTAAAGAGKFLAEKVFTNPEMVRWMVGQARVPAAALGQQLAILATKSQQWEPESRQVAEEFVKTMGGIDWPLLTTVKALSDATATR